MMFVVVFGLSQWLFFALELHGHLDWLMGGNAAVLNSIMNALGIPATLEGTLVHLQNHTLQISIDCTGITIASLYAAVIIAYPLSLRTRGLALVVGLPVIAIANIVRLIGVALTSQYLSAEVFQFAHDYFFKVFMLLVVIGLWIAWLQFARVHAKEA